MKNAKKLKQLACFSTEKRRLKRKLSIVNLTLCCEHVVRLMMKWNLLFLLSIEFFFVWLFCCELIVIRINECLSIRSFMISFPKQSFCEFSFWCWVFHHRFTFILFSNWVFEKVLNHSLRNEHDEIILLQIPLVNCDSN